MQAPVYGICGWLINHVSVVPFHSGQDDPGGAPTAAVADTAAAGRIEEQSNGLLQNRTG
jgi:hypothetical protein